MGASPSGITRTSPPLAGMPIPNTPVLGDASRRVGVVAGSVPRMGTPMGDASQRSPMMASTRFGDAFQRSPMLFSPGLAPLPKPSDASLRTPPKGVPSGAQVLGTSPSKPVGSVDASQRTPPSKSSPLGVASWGAATASIAATRDAAMAVPCSMDSSPQNQASCTTTGDVSLHITDSVRCWLAGLSGKDMPSPEELAARLRAAQPVCYDD